MDKQAVPSHRRQTTEKDKIVEVMAEALRLDGFGDFSYAARLRLASTALDAALPLIEPQWRPIEEAPKDGTRVLVYGWWRPSWKDPEPRMAVDAITDGAESYFLASLNGEAAHFMPLPTPPETDNGQTDG